MKYLLLWVIWLTLYFAPMFAGDFYDNHFYWNQALISTLLIFLFLGISKSNYIKSLCGVATIVIAFNYIDYHLDFSVFTYGTIMLLLNILEALILVAFGIRTYLHGNCRNHKQLWRTFPTVGFNMESHKINHSAPERKAW